MATTTIITGDATKAQRDRRFVCAVCGCQFIAPYADYTPLLDLDYVPGEATGYTAACECPTCGETAYSPVGSGGEVAAPKRLVILSLPGKQLYKPGDTFVTTGLALGMEYDDGSIGTVDLTDCTLSPTTSAALTTSDTKITVTHTDSSETVDIPIQVRNQVIPLVEPTNTNYVYTGSAQEIEVRYFDSNTATRANYSKTAAGSYTAAYTPKTGYCWPNGSVSAVEYAWVIEKAPQTVSLDKSELELTAIATPGTITVTRLGNGAVSAESSDTGVCTVAVNGTTVTVTAVADGEATVTVKVAAGTNHAAGEDQTCAVTVELA